MKERRFHFEDKLYEALQHAAKLERRSIASFVQLAIESRIDWALRHYTPQQNRRNRNSDSSGSSLRSSPAPVGARAPRGASGENTKNKPLGVKALVHRLRVLAPGVEHERLQAAAQSHLERCDEVRNLSCLLCLDSMPDVRRDAERLQAIVPNAPLGKCLYAATGIRGDERAIKLVAAMAKRYPGSSIDRCMELVEKHGREHHAKPIPDKCPLCTLQSAGAA